MKIVKNILITLITILVLMVIAVNLYNFISIKFLKKDLPTINGYAVLEVVSGSMQPVINIGDLIIIDTKDKDYEIGKVITFYDVNGNFVTHRIIEIKGDEIITQGDFNNTIDEAISKDDVVGVYVRKVEELGIIIRSFRSPFVMLMILIIGILICVLTSTDSKCNPILTDDEKEFMEFREYQKNKDKKENVKKQDIKKNTTPKKETIKEDSSRPKKKTSEKKSSSVTKKASKKEEVPSTQKKNSTKKSSSTTKKKLTTSKSSSTKKNIKKKK